VARDRLWARAVPPSGSHRYGPLPPDSVFLLVAGVAEAPQAIHAVGIVHRNLKPSNVILAAEGPRVIDFGIAQAGSAPALTLDGAQIGSPRFMAPGQACGQSATPADVFALGSLATCTITGPAAVRQWPRQDPLQRPQPTEIIESAEPG
jgi:serine/threonine protein kinase